MTLSFEFKVGATSATKTIEQGPLPEGPLNVTINIPSAKEASRAAAKEFLTSQGITFNDGPGGLIVAEGEIDLNGQNLRQLPDLSQVALIGDFYCAGNNLTSLKGAPCSVSGSFYCSLNPALTSLEFAPGMVGKEFICESTGITSFEHCPQNFKNLVTDLGDFKSWDEVPEKLRVSPETLAREATTLKGQVNVSRPLTFRPGGAMA